MFLFVINQASLVSDTDIRTMISALQAQMNVHVSPACGVQPPKIVFTKSVPPITDANSGYLVFLDVPDQAGAGGYHLDSGLVPWGKVFCAPYNGNKFSPGGISTAFSHEALELLFNKWINLWADGTSTAHGSQYAHEVCDPVEGGSYTISVSSIDPIDGETIPTVLPSPVDVSVSNFVLPAWFDDDADSGSTQFDFLKNLSSPFTLAPGGYYLIRSPGGAGNPVFGDKVTEDQKALILKKHRVQRHMQKKG